MKRNMQRKQRINPMIMKACERAAERLLLHRWKLWFWADSIGLEGLLDATEITGNPKYFAYVYGLFKAWIPRIQFHSKFDHTAAGVALLRCFEKTEDQALLEAARNFADYLLTFRKTFNGCPIHYEDAHIELPPELPADHPNYDRQKEALRKSMASANAGPCVFVDSVHFQGTFLAKLFHITGEKKYLAQAEETIGPQVALLWDEKEKLFHHFWSERSKSKNGVLWGRGNGWGMLGLLQTLYYLPQKSLLYSSFKNVFIKQAERLRELQNKSGDWHTVLNDPQSYLEASIAAFVVDGFSFAIKQKWLSANYKTVVEKAWGAMWKHVRSDGLFDGVSFETFPSTRAEHYRSMPRGAIVPWGQGPFLTACHSYLNHLKGGGRS